MSKVLDLSAFVEETLDIKMPDGSVLNIPKPTQRMVITLMGLRDAIENQKDPVAIVGSLNKTVLDILNSNTNEIKFEPDYVETMAVNMKTAIMKAYSEYIAGIQSNPNS